MIEAAMRFVSLPAIGLIFVVLGVALAFPSSTYSGPEQPLYTGWLAIDVSRPQTLLLNPVVGGICLAAGLAMLHLGFRDAAP